MLCEKCGLKEATIILVEVIDGRREEHRLCEICAEEAAMAIPQHLPPDTSTGAPDTLIVPGEEEGGVRPQTKRIIRELVCPSCGLSYETFLKTMRFGCADCYKAFRENLEVLFKDLHGTATYRGRRYRRNRKAYRLIKEKVKLESQLEMLIAQEQFEKAAEVRDRIQEILKELEWDSNP